jgi:hypothetical protein
MIMRRKLNERVRSHMLAWCSTALLGLALANASSGTAFAQGSPALNSKAADVGTLLSNVQRNGFVRVIVLFEPPVPANEVRADPASIADVTTRVGAIQDAIIASHLAGAPTSNAGAAFNRGIVRFPITPGFAANVNERELDSLAADPRILTIQYDRADPPSLLQSVPLIGMTTAYTNGATGAGWAVAVLDTGVQSNHELLSGKVIAEACFSNGGGSGGQTSLCPNGTATQTGAGAANPAGPCLNGGVNICEHGTHVAGIAAGLNTSQSAGEPTNGVGKDAKVFAVQVFTRFNDTTNCGGPAPCVLAFTSDQISALNHVFANLTLAGGVKVASVNMSLGGGLNSSTCDTDTRKPAIDNLRGAGVLTAIASGNNGSTTQISTPGCISTAVTVGSTTKADAVSSFSNMSAVVDLLAPGGASGGSCAFGASNIGILSSVATSPLATGSYACFVGTSMATPHVAGAIAALRTACPTKTADQIETALKNTGLSVTDTRSGGVQTKPRIRVDLALAQLACGSPPVNDNFASALTVNVNALATGTNEAATKEAGEPNHGGSAGGRSVWWTFTAPKTGRFVVSTAGSDFDTLLGIYTGGTVNALTTIAGNDDCAATNRLHSCVSFAGIAGTVYRIAVDGFNAASGNINLIVTAPLVTADFNGDSKSDILWRHTTGSVAMWLMNGVSPTSINSVTSAVANDWSIIAEDDFDGDGKSDLLWRNVNGHVVLWQMNGAAPTATPTVTTAVGLEWAIAGTCDFNGDGKADILWRHTTGAVAMWLMNGATPFVIQSVDTVPNEWKIAGLGDFNGDGKCDLLWRHDSGPVAMWLMNGPTPISTVGVADTSLNEWSIIGTRDFNGDGKADILWRHTTGSVAMWIMNGSTPFATLGVTDAVPNDWKIVALGDFNGDSKFDFLWRHDSGPVVMWQMNGAAPIAQNTVTNDIPNEWRILGVTTTVAVPAPGK